MAYTRRTCHECGFRDIQPNMQQKTVQVTAGKSKSSVSLATFVGAAFGHKKSGRAIGNSILNSDQRTYTRTKTIYLCDNCSGVAAARNAQLAKERAKRERAAAALQKMQERAETRAAKELARATNRAVELQARAGEPALTPELLQENKERVEILALRLADGQLDVQETTLVKRASRNKFLVLLRTALEAFCLFFAGGFISVAALPEDQWDTPLTILMIGFPVYILFVYVLRARKITSARQALLNPSLEMRGTV